MHKIVDFFNSFFIFYIVVVVDGLLRWFPAKGQIECKLCVERHFS